MRGDKVYAFVLIGLIVASFAVEAASPPTLLNYQGVLRSASDVPLSGTYDMVFRFYDAPTAGDEILVDSHTAGLGGAVAVAGGLFSVQLGGGSITDGSGPGTYASLAEVFRDYAQVYLTIEVGSELLSPRTRIVAAAYALNAAHLEGKAAAQFLDTSSNSQTKSGDLTVSGAMTVGGQVKIVGGSPAAGRVLTTDGTGMAAWQDPAPGPQGPPGPVGPGGPQGPTGVTGRPLHAVTVQNQDPAGPPNNRSGSSVVIGVDGLPLVAFNGGTDGEGFVTHCSVPDCSAGVTNYLFFGFEHLSLTIAPTGLGLICGSASNNTWIISCENADCSSQSFLNLFSGNECSIAIGTDGLPLISVAHGNTLDVVHCGDSTCFNYAGTSFDSGGNKTRTSLAIGGDGLGLISYIDDTANTLKVAHCSNVACTAATITSVDVNADALGNADQGTSLAIGPAGLGVIAYYESTGRDLRVVACTNAVCSTSTRTSLDTTGEVGTDPAITIGADGLPVITYRDNLNRALKIARCGTSSCSGGASVRVLDGAAGSGWGSSVTLGTDGFPVILHWNEDDMLARLIHCSNAFCLPFVRPR